jgi:hypothetical protein
MTHNCAKAFICALFAGGLTLSTVLPAQAGYEGWLRVTMPIGEHGIDGQAMQYSLDAGTGGRSRNGRQGKRKTKRVAMLDFRIAGSPGSRLFTTRRAASNGAAQKVSFRGTRTGNNVQDCTRHAYGNPLGSYCRAAEDYKTMVQAYQRFIAASRRIGFDTGTIQPAGHVQPVMPGGLKHIYLDYWVAHNAYKRALHFYHLAVRARRGRRP